MFAYWIVAATLLLHREQSLAQLNSDGFNIYKDLLRSKPDDPYSIFEQNDDPSLYVYRAPSLIVMPEGESGVDKRGVNHFKSFMLSPQREAELAEGTQDKQEDQIFHFPRVVIKRGLSSKTLAPCRWSSLASRLDDRRASLLGSTRLPGSFGSQPPASLAAENN